jgi:hypothetical protein
MDLSLYTEVSPYFALVNGKDEQQEEAILGRIAMLSELKRGLLADESTAQRVVDMAQQAGIDAKFGVAIAKLIGLRVLGDVASSAVPTLLERVGVENVKAQSVATQIETLITSIPNEPKEEATLQPQVAMDSARPLVPLDMASRRIPPLTQQIPEAGSGPVPQRNIIDLRKPPESRA